MTELIPSNLLGNAFSSWELTVRDSFSLKALYVRLHEFLKEEGWKDLQAGGDDYETFYGEQQAEDGSLSHTIWWRGVKEPKNNGAGNIKFYLNLNISTFIIKEVEMMIKGQKSKIDQGELKINCKLYLDLNNYHKQGDDWDSHFILKHFKKKFWDRLNKGVVGAAKGELVGFSNDLYEFIQVFTGVRPQSGPKDFIPIKGIGN